MDRKKKIGGSLKPRISRSIEQFEIHWGIHEWNLDVSRFYIYLTGEAMQYDADDTNDRSEPGVEYQMSARFIKNIQTLSSIDPTRPILIHMKTCGGDFNEGMAIYDTMLFCPNPIAVLSYTHARSMSSIILQAADRRVLMPNSYFLFHEGYTGAMATSKGFQSFAEWEKKTMTPTLLDIYVRSLKQKGKFRRQSPARVREMLQEMMDRKEDVYLTAKEAVEWGFADHVFDGDWVALTKFPRNFHKRPEFNDLTKQNKPKT